MTNTTNRKPRISKNYVNSFNWTKICGWCMEGDSRKQRADRIKTTSVTLGVDRQVIYRKIHDCNFTAVWRHHEAEPITLEKAHQLFNDDNIVNMNRVA